jgi:hypothetical protein
VLILRTLTDVKMVATETERASHGRLLIVH